MVFEALRLHLTTKLRARMRSTLSIALGLASLLACYHSADAGIITFDDFSAATVNDTVADGYKGFDWDNVWIANKSAFPNTGFANGAVSGNYTAFNGYGFPGEITGSSIFDFESVYLAGGFNAGNVTFQGFNGTTLLYSQTVVVNITTPQLVNFDFDGINRLRFSSTGGHFAMDNLTLNPSASAVPEPGSLTILVICAMSAGGLRLRRRIRPA